MNKHLKLVRELNDTFLFSQANHGTDMPLSDMDMVMRQALLFEAGSAVFRTIKTGDMLEILASLINLAYCALEAIACQGSDVVEHPVTWQHDGFVTSIMRIVSDKINRCSSGKASDYSEVYCLCAHLTRSFINADFDHAFQMIHDAKMAKQLKMPDLSGSLYE